METKLFTFENALEVQAEDLNRYRAILKPEIMELLEQRAKFVNRSVNDPYDTWRGTDIEQFVSAISYNLAQGAKLSDLTYKSNFAKPL